MSYDDHDSPRTEPRPATCRSCGQPSHQGRPCRIDTQPLPRPISLRDIAEALTRHAAEAFADRKDARAARLRDMADELLGEGEHRPKPCTSHDC